MIRVGKIVATHGLQGDLIMTHVLEKAQWLKKGQTLHLEMQKGSFIPYFVSQFKINNNNEYLVHIEDIDKVEAAKLLVTKNVYADEKSLIAFSANNPLLWIGFAVTDVEKGLLGKIKDVTNTGFQWIASLTYTDKEVLIPLTPQVITRTDIKAQTIHINLPPGLLDIYLDS